MFYLQFISLCKKHSISPSNLMKKLEYSTSKITAWKNGSIPNLEIASKIADYFNVSLDYLAAREDNVKIKLTSLEKQLIDNYKKHPELQSAVNQLLKIDYNEIDNKFPILYIDDQYDEPQDMSLKISRSQHIYTDAKINSVTFEELKTHMLKIYQCNMVQKYMVFSTLVKQSKIGIYYSKISLQSKQQIYDFISEKSDMDTAHSYIESIKKLCSTYKYELFESTEEIIK